MKPTSKIRFAWSSTILGFLVSLYFLPAFLFGLSSNRWFEDGHPAQLKLARQVAAEVLGGLDRQDYRTGSARFDGEWLFGTYLMAGIGLCQVAEQFPEFRDTAREASAHCIRQLQSDTVTAFDEEAWGRHPLRSLDKPSGHAAYLGYFNVFLGVYEKTFQDTQFRQLHDRISEALQRRLSLSPNGLVATYPHEWYPVDNAAVISSVLLWSQLRQDAAARQHAETSRQNFALKYRDRQSGLLIQAVDPSGRAYDSPRGSGTALSCFLFAHSDPEFSRSLYISMKEELNAPLLGFGGMREYPAGLNGRGDIDSGPILFGRGFSATGFSIAGARLARDRAIFRQLYATARFAGIPIRSGDQERYLTAGPLGNAILLAVLTTPH